MPTNSQKLTLVMTNSSWTIFMMFSIGDRAKLERVKVKINVGLVPIPEFNFIIFNEKN